MFLRNDFARFNRRNPTKSIIYNNATADLSPLFYPGLLGWWDASDLLNNLTTPADGVQISTWVDKSGAGANVTQGTPANQPIFKLGIQNNLPSVLFSSASLQQLTRANFITTTHTIFCVATATTAGNKGIVYNGSSGGNGYGIFLNSTFSILYGGVIQKNGAAQNTTPHIFVMTWNGSTTTWTIDGSIQAINNPTTAPIAPTVNFAIGSLLGNNYWNGYIHEVGIMSAACTTVQTASLSKYLGQKWGLNV
jgi:hypothetical protein